MGYKRKTALTQRNIKNALVNLLETNKFDFITINQIVEEAEITRSTFYRYYDDKYELISEIEEEILEHIHKERQKMDENYSEEDLLDVEMFKHLFDTLEPYSNTIHRLLGYNGDSGFEMKLKNEISRRFIDIEQHNHISQVRADLVKEYVYVIMIKTFQYWSAYKDDVDINEIAATIRDIQLKGLRKAIGL
ncbi:TetR/AcrR family transcriptional regulator [Mammaliicoccus sciuri]|uniref:TetR/AcrR family transcriptional regulator n=1 Tax=Mammaliicoccus sciuri TaxID=1296 RepID=UPI001432EFA3|nr:TetR/AcrR family transcriptional regulator [Mammaliicoccus sciuri]MBO1207234.1 TetR/AcrR family transcriptional regulator [Mammaliicoccus sciuri]MCC2090131.1 TetR/AcrR family transcriptional regulator [Mammaliicoccus sciuri]MCD8824113.1 TetR/AcrR family transcriptional regulator [Mammaliicoccus sciuri]MCD8884834.1 TetR/AcrR family transcriptional regulator [Mammaliicoccus sciuri]MCJ0954535.1 TetR/AcrR family transcriptional regulator [Mammaliicoccus sciuri]